ncbi:MAG: MliC family protein, partial [Patescibacteria group bacterium]
MSKLQILGVLVASLAFVAVATPVEAENNNGNGLTEDQIDSVIEVLVSFDVDEETIVKVKKTLKGEEVEGADEVKESDDEDSNEEPDSVDRQGERKGKLPEQASSRAHQVQNCLKIGRMIRNGSAGSDVEELQKFLKEEGDFDYEKTTGYYGPITEQAVKKFQKRKGIVANGSPEETGYGQVGPKTRAAIHQSTCLRETAPGQQKEEKDTDDEKESEDVFIYECPSDDVIEVNYYDDSELAKIAFGDKEYSLDRVRSASGAKYANEDETVIFWGHQGEAMLEIDGERVAEGCQLDEDVEEEEDEE